jgi:putative oxidoreductase
LLGLGLLLIRLVIGLSFMAHGAQKLFGSFGGGGIKVFGEHFEKLGICKHPKKCHGNWNWLCRWGF